MNIYHKSIESQDPNDDELAHKLLKRIREEREKNEDKEKTGGNEKTASLKSLLITC